MSKVFYDSSRDYTTLLVKRISPVSFSFGKIPAGGLIYLSN